MSDGRTILLLGASGFLGTHLRAAASEAGLEVVAPPRARAGGEPGVDLLDQASLEACIGAARPQLIVNAAGSSSVARSWERPAETFSVNATGVLNLLEAAALRAPEAHLTCLSSAAVYGEPQEGRMPLGEDEPLAPVSPYGAAKQAMEDVCAQYRRSRGLRVAVVRAFNLLGPGQPPFSAASALARQIAAAEADGAESVELALGNPAAARDATDVRDAARLIVAAAALGLDGTYNLCSGLAPTVAELATALAELTPLAVTTRVDPDLARPSDPPLLLGDPSRLREGTGLSAAIPLSQSLVDTLAWRRSEPAGA